MSDVFYIALTFVLKLIHEILNYGDGKLIRVASKNIVTKF